MIEPERGGERRTVHRNMLFHCSEELPDAPTESNQKKSVKVTKKVEVRTEDPQNDSDESDDDSDIDDVPAQRKLPPRNRRNTEKFNYSRLGNPTINAIHTSTDQSHKHYKQSVEYKTWLQQLWMVGWLTDQLLKLTTPTR